MTDEAILEPLETAGDLDRVLERGGQALVMKHSPRCWQSFMAIGQVRRFALDHPEMPVHVVDVIARPELAREVGLRLGIRHESPQVIFLRDGRPVWHASHAGVRHGSISDAVEG